MSKNDTFDNEDGFNVLFDSVFGGDVGNAIMAQKARGQSKMVNSAVLPKQWGHRDAQEAYERVGIKVLGEADDLFYNVELPDGWRKEATGHSMWSNLIDDKGRERANIFYKAAFYDRDAHISFTRRFYVNSQPVGGYDNPDYEMRKTPVEVIVKDNGVIVWQRGNIEKPDYDNRDSIEAHRAEVDSLLAQAKAWLEADYPEWESPFAYWD